jgi:hypothetical protein
MTNEPDTRTPQPVRFPWTEDVLHQRVRAALEVMWATRRIQAEKQIEAGRVDAGVRGEATGGRHMDAFAALLGELASAAGYETADIRMRKGIDVPGFYRPTKQWDVVVTRRDRLCAAVELKSIAGSFSKNLNNRTEEALGSATDVWAAFKEGTLGANPPWLGYLFVIRSAPASTVPVKVRRAVRPIDTVFERTSYVDRYGILCERMVRERVYSGAAYIAADEAGGTYSEPVDDLGFASFSRAFFGHLVGCV